MYSLSYGSVKKSKAGTYRELLLVSVLCGKQDPTRQPLRSLERGDYQKEGFDSILAYDHTEGVLNREERRGDVVVVQRDEQALPMFRVKVKCL